MKRVLVWHVDRVHEGDESQGPVFYADFDYTPGAVRLMARTAPSVELKVDIRDDGVSLFTSNYAVLNKGATLEENAEDYDGDAPMIAAGSVVSMHVIASGGI